MLRAKNGPRRDCVQDMHGGEDGDTTNGSSSRTQYTQKSQTDSTRKAGAILDDWVETTYREAVRVRRILTLSGRQLPSELDAVLDYLETDFPDDWPMQIALFMAWRTDGITELAPSPDNLPAHNLHELQKNLEVFARILSASGKGRAESEVSYVA